MDFNVLKCVDDGVQARRQFISPVTLSSRGLIRQKNNAGGHLTQCGMVDSPFFLLDTLLKRTAGNVSTHENTRAAPRTAAKRSANSGATPSVPINCSSAVETKDSHNAVLQDTEKQATPPLPPGEKRRKKRRAAGASRARVKLPILH